MQTPRSTRNSVLGKRAHQSEQQCEQLLTPDATPNPKRARTSTSELDGDGNKENVAPFNLEALNSDLFSPSPRASRALRRTATEAVVTPTRAVNRRRSSTTAVAPSVEISQLSIATPPPSPPSSLQPLHVRARALLRPTSDSSSSMPGRDAERQVITKFVADFIGAKTVDENSRSTLYISGAPGTGKTALVNSLVDSMGLDQCNVQVLVINCMALKDVDALWERLMEELDGKKTKATKGKRRRTENMIEATLAALENKCVLILDELDHITSTASSLASLFSITASNPAVLRVIGIANTHTLTASSASVVLQVQTLHFAPYTPSQLLSILQSRLSPLEEETKKFLSQPTLTLLTKKIAALTGDVRSLFEVLRSAIDIALTSSSPAVDESLPKSVTPANVLAALKAYSPARTTSSSSATSSKSSSEIVSKIQQLGLQARLALLSLLLATKRLEAKLPLSSSSTSTSTKRNNSTSDGIDAGQLYAYYGAILLRVESGIFTPVSRSEFGDLIGMLEGLGLVTVPSGFKSTSPVKGGKRTFGRSASFGCGSNKSNSLGDVRLAPGVWLDEALRGLGIQDETSGDIQDEEVRAVWAREKARLVKDLKAVEFKAGKTNVSLFEDAMKH
ncbi:P-loop containing nucleoside triphosphate hydrolase protein [Mycena floridula]|nr:P-loop containing nucleoside triphosphate hydrolase protein [Mycena floridula]